MKYIIAGTNRPNSKTMQVSRLIQKIYADEGEQVEIIDLAHVGLEHLSAAAEYGEIVPDKMKAVIEKINNSDGLIIVTPEYNGSMPGALKYFIDHWSYPRSYEFRPVCFVGLGGRFGALRPVEHLQGVFGYRNGFIYPERVFIMDIFRLLSPEGEVSDQRTMTQLRQQAQGFRAFTRALSTAGIDANSRHTQSLKSSV